MRPGKEMVSEPARSLQEVATPAVPTQAVPQPGGKDMELEVVEGLKKLDDLRQSGALTEGEFQRAKRRATWQAPRAIRATRMSAPKLDRQ